MSLAGLPPPSTPTPFSSLSRYQLLPINRMLLDLGQGGRLHGRRHRRLGGDLLHQVQVDGVRRIRSACQLKVCLSDA